MRYKRILLKLSGEGLAGNEKYGISPSVLQDFSREIKEIHQMGVQVTLVIGGGNIHRGVSGATKGMDRTSSDYMGMLATVINSLALQDSLERQGVQTRVMSSIEMRQICELYIRRRALRHLEKKRVLIFAAGTGNPYFTTDTTAALRANEINADVIIKATRVEGVYDDDPLKNPKAKMFKKLRYMDVLGKNLKVMDSAAISLCMDNELDIIVFNVFKSGNIKKVMTGSDTGTIVTNK